MGKIIYDFREGLEREKLVFRENTHYCKEYTFWALYLLLDWTYACAWYALFHWFYINYEYIAFWTLAGIWIVFIIIFILNAIINLVKNKRNKKHKKEMLLKELNETNNNQLANGKNLENNFFHDNN